MNDASSAKKRKAPSLIRRLWLASALTLPILIGFSSFALNRAYTNSLDSAEYEALLSQIYAMLAIAEPDGDGLLMPDVMANPRFETPSSGLYARIINASGDRVWLSNSLLSSPLSFALTAVPSAGTIREGWPEIENTQHRSLSFTTVWEMDGKDSLFTFELFHAQDAKHAEIRTYQRALALWLGGMAALLLLTQVVITLWGLKPLKALAKEIDQVETGQSERLSGFYPSEISPVTRSLNRLLSSEEARRERYKNSLSDLAHSLKTPLSVIRSQGGSAKKDTLIDEQVDRMSAIVDHQLKRASAEVQTLYTARLALRPIVTRIANALQKVYADKNISCSITVPDGFNVSIEENDCMEILGNILENAFKYGKTAVNVSAYQEESVCIIAVEDDGPGITKKQSDDILARGARADTHTSGQGIGLAIAVDILSSYNGALEVGRSAAGGAAFRIGIPKA